VWLPDAVLDHVQEVADEPDLSVTKYRLTGTLGRGGMGVVYTAEDADLLREVAIKVASSATADEPCDRLRREARILARLEHPGIVPVHDVGTLPDGRVFYVMKRVRGERLDAWARRGPERPVALRLFQRICEAVAFAHARGVIHRDLKPENVMVGAFGEALVMDWGIAKGPAPPAADAENGAPQAPARPPAPGIGEGGTAAGTVMGTVGYMAPEQARGDLAAVDVRADVYALGAVLSFLLTGEPPSSPPGAATPSVPKPLASICARAMAPAPGDRYPTALDLAADVGRFLDGEPVQAHREGAAARLARFVSRHRVVLGLLGTYLLVRVLLIVLAR
jgi:serine/threonine-protein kinase